MGILDGYQFDPAAYSGSNAPPGWLGLLLGGAPLNAPNPSTPTGFGVDLPQNSQPDSGALPQPTAPAAAPAAAPSNPFSSLFSGLGSMFSPSSAQAAPASQNAPTAPQGPDLLDRLTAGASNFTTGGNPLAGIINSIRGLTTGQRTDPAGIQQQQVLSTYHATRQALEANGTPAPQAAALAQAAALNPEIMKTLAPMLYSKPQFEKIKDALGNEVPIFANPDKQTITYPSANGGGEGGAGGMQVGMLARGVNKYDPYLPPDQYLSQFSPDVQAVMKQQLNGDAMPTGNPRQQQLWSTAKGFTALYAQKAGIPFSDELYNAKRKMRTDLAASSNNSMGGILSNGDSAFSHLAELSGSFADLGNYAGPEIPGGGHIGDIGNLVTNSLLPTPQTMGKLQAVRDNALKYGQESTKLYAGTGGGEGERTHALSETAGPGTNAEVQASFLEKEKSLMLDRLRAKFAQIRDTLGDEEAQKIIAGKMPSLEANVAKIDANIAKLRGRGAPDQAAAAPQQQTAAVPAGAIAALKQNPKLADQFDAKYGAGSSARALGR